MAFNPTTVRRAPTQMRNAPSSGRQSLEFRHRVHPKATEIGCILRFQPDQENCMELSPFRASTSATLAQRLSEPRAQSAEGKSVQK